MFSDKFWAAKFFLPLMGIAALCHYGLQEGRQAYPEIWQFMIDPAASQGRQVWIAYGEVRSIGDGEYVLYDPGNRRSFCVKSPAPPGVRPGDRIEAVGTFHDNRTVTIDPDRTRLLPAHRSTRRFMMFISLAALVWLAWRTSRTYRWSGVMPAPFARR